MGGLVLVRFFAGIFVGGLVLLHHTNRSDERDSWDDENDDGE